MTGNRLVVVGSVTDKQYQPVLDKMTRDGMKPELFIVTDEMLEVYRGCVTRYRQEFKGRPLNDSDFLEGAVRRTLGIDLDTVGFILSDLYHYVVGKRCEECAGGWCPQANISLYFYLKVPTLETYVSLIYGIIYLDSESNDVSL